MKDWVIGKLLRSRKVWIAISSIILPPLIEKLSLDPALAQNAFWALVALLGGQAMADWGKEGK